MADIEVSAPITKDTMVAVPLWTLAKLHFDRSRHIFPYEEALIRTARYLYLRYEIAILPKDLEDILNAEPSMKKGYVMKL